MPRTRRNDSLKKAALERGDRGRRAPPAALADAVAAQGTEAAATGAGLLFRDLSIDFPLNISIVQSYADAGKPGAAVES